MKLNEIQYRPCPLACTHFHLWCFRIRNASSSGLGPFRWCLSSDRNLIFMSIFAHPESVVSCLRQMLFMPSRCCFFGVARMWMSDGMLRKALRRESIDRQPNEKFPSRKVNRDTSGFLFRSTRFATDSMFCCSQRYLELGCCFHRIQFPSNDAFCEPPAHVCGRIFMAV